MKRACWLCLLLCLMCGCHAPATPEATTPSAAPSLPDGQSMHLVVAVQGPLSIKRVGWRSYAPARFGTVLRFGDLLQTETTAEVTIACADLTLVTMTGGPRGLPCKQTEPPVLTYRGTQVNPARSVPGDAFPQVLTPRMTRLINPHPVVRWISLPGVITYTVSVRGSGLAWHAEVAGAAMTYPDSAPALVEGVTYKVTVSCGGRTSDEETSPGLGFALLGSSEAAVVRGEIAKVEALALPPAAQQFLIAHIYATHQLYAEATETMSMLATTMPEPSVARYLGDLYVAVQLPREAEVAYIRALQLADQTGDVEDQALAHKALSGVYEAVGNRAAAISEVQQALRLYQRLGDDAAVNDLQAQANGLSKP